MMMQKYLWYGWPMKKWDLYQDIFQLSLIGVISSAVTLIMWLLGPISLISIYKDWQSVNEYWNRNRN